MTVPTANVEAIWPSKPDTSTNNGTGRQQAITLAANDYTGVSANYQLVFTAGADGAVLEGLKFTPAGTNASATVARIFINNGSAQTTATNNTFAGEQTLQSTTATATAALPSPEFYFPGGRVNLGPNERIYVGLATAVAAGWAVTPIGGAQY